MMWIEYETIGSGADKFYRCELAKGLFIEAQTLELLAQRAEDLTCPDCGFELWTECQCDYWGEQQQEK